MQRSIHKAILSVLKVGMKTFDRVNKRFVEEGLAAELVMVMHNLNTPLYVNREVVFLKKSFTFRSGSTPLPG